MAVITRTTVSLLLLIVNIYCVNTVDTDADYNSDDSQTDQVLKDNGDVIDDTNIQNYERDENLEKQDVTEVYTTTEIEDTEERDFSTTDTTEAVTDYTLSKTDSVYKPKDGDDIYTSNNEATTVGNVIHNNDLSC